MAKNLYTVMTRDEVIRDFTKYYLPDVIRQFEKDGEVDAIARREEWHTYVDALHRSKEISDWQAANWSVPEICDNDDDEKEQLRRDEKNGLYPGKWDYCN
jgi:hypothetical protein